MSKFDFDFKVKVPTPEINLLVQQKLLDMGYVWLNGSTSTDGFYGKYLFVDGGLISKSSAIETFNKESSRQLHYLQILTGDLSGQLFKYGNDVWPYYYSGWMAHYVKNGVFKSVEYNLGRVQWDTKDTSAIKLINENEDEMEEITMNKSSEMPELIAGQHAVRTKDGLYLVLENHRGLFGKALEGETWLRDLENAILEVHNLPYYQYETLTEAAYNEETLIWRKSDDNRKQLRKEYAEMQQQMEELKRKMDEIGGEL